LVPQANGTDYLATLRTTPIGDNPDYQPAQADLWVNDYRLSQWLSVARDWKKNGNSYVVQIMIPGEALRRGRNVLTLQLYNRLGGRSDAAALLTFDRPAARPRLFGLMVGINDYRDSKPSPGGKGLKLGNLTLARDDAAAMKQAWDAQQRSTIRRTSSFCPTPGRTVRTFLPPWIAWRNRSRPTIVLCCCSPGMATIPSWAKAS